MSVKQSHRRALSVAALALVFALAAAETADARRGGSFGSRGMRTYSAPRPTYTAPTAAGPIRRSMTSPTEAPAARPAAQAPAYGQAPQPQRGGFLRRWGGPILGGIAAAGLIGLLMGHGFGGAAGMGALLLQLGIAALVIMLVMRLFRRRQDQQPAYAASAGAAGPIPFPPRQDPPYQPRYEAPPQAAYQASPQGGAPTGREGDELGLGQADFDAFERLLIEVQSAFGREDYAALRERTTPEVMSYLAEELSQNAVAGRRNEVRDVRLISGDLAKSWNEGDRDYATVAMRYASIDVMRDRNDGHIVEGVEQPSETVEIWTFVRERTAPWGGAWKLTAIQDLDGAPA